MTANETSLIEAEAITHVLNYARENRIPFPSVYTKNYEGGANRGSCRGPRRKPKLDISAGATMSVQQGDIESLVADDIVRFGKPLADRVASILMPKH
jgi:hypothetical protein